MRHEPALNYDFPLAETAREGGWHTAGRYSLWMGRQGPGDPSYQMVERHPEGLVRLPQRPRLMRLVPAGIPFRIAHLFAPFRVSDADMIYLRAAIDPVVYHVLLAAAGQEIKEDHLVWICPGCGAEMARRGFPSGRRGLNAFWAFMLDEVRAFNASPRRQACESCGARHAKCYGFDAALDRPGEATARSSW